MNKYTLINIRANLNSCLSIGVNTAVAKLIELCIHRIDQMLEADESKQTHCKVDGCNNPISDLEDGWLICDIHIKEEAEI